MPLISIGDAINVFLPIYDLVGIVVCLKERNRSASLYFLINFVVVERASTAHNKENRDHVPEAKRSHLASTREKPSVSNNRDRSNTAEECARANRDRLGLSADRDMLDGIVTRHPSNEIVHPVVGQRRGERYPAFTSCA